MKFFTCKHIREIDSYTIENEPIKSVDLMERAALGLFGWLVSNYHSSIPFVVFSGPGNNGGDGLAVARMLAMVGYNVKVFILKSENYSNDTLINIQRLEGQGLVEISYLANAVNFPRLNEDAVIVDALYGSGLSRPLSGIDAKLVGFINASNNEIVSIDIPSGLMGEDNPYPNSNAVIRASKTLSLQFPKLSFFFPENSEYVGHWDVIDIKLHKKIISETYTPFSTIDNGDCRSIIKTRGKYSHKGTFGHALIVAGSYGMFGASILAVKACIRSGAGLVTAHIPKNAYTIVQSSIPEALVEIDIDESYFSGINELSKYSAIGIGPGIGQNEKTILAFEYLLQQANVPFVIDADGLNIISKRPDLLDKLPNNSIITPHIGEFNRLFGSYPTGYDRLNVAKDMASKLNIIIVLKGAHTQVILPNGKVFFNTSGNPGMATGGSGDVLTGIITGLVAQGYSSSDASILGVYLHGLAADIAVPRTSQQSLCASDIIDNLGKAFSTLKLVLNE
jgi:ADP-dependent NAD(P)H-hydrate dehydratase / NAD(P)H-hydrate epimerase